MLTDRQTNLYIFLPTGKILTELQLRMWEWTYQTLEKLGDPCARAIWNMLAENIHPLPVEEVTQ